MTEIDVTLKSPFTALVVGPTGSGKTRMLMELIRDSSTGRDATARRNYLLLRSVAGTVCARR